MTLKHCTGWANLRALFVMLAMALSVASVLAQSPTFARTDYPFIGHQVVADFNGDGVPDLAGQAYLVQAVAVRLNTPIWRATTPLPGENNHKKNTPTPTGLLTTVNKNRDL